MLQNNDAALVEKIQSSITNTIPLWKNQMVLALGISDVKSALKMEKAVTDLTNDMLVKNSETLKQGSIEIAKESERAIVDIETLDEVFKDLNDLVGLTKIKKTLYELVDLISLTTITKEDINYE